MEVDCLFPLAARRLSWISGLQTYCRAYSVHPAEHSNLRYVLNDLDALKYFLKSLQAISQRDSAGNLIYPKLFSFYYTGGMTIEMGEMLKASMQQDEHQEELSRALKETNISVRNTSITILKHSSQHCKFRKPQRSLHEVVLTKNYHAASHTPSPPYSQLLEINPSKKQNIRTEKSNYISTYSKKAHPY